MFFGRKLSNFSGFIRKDFPFKNAERNFLPKRCIHHHTCHRHKIYPWRRVNIGELLKDVANELQQLETTVTAETPVNNH